MLKEETNASWHTGWILPFWKF